MTSDREDNTRGPTVPAADATRTHTGRWDETITHLPAGGHASPLVLSPGVRFGGYQVEKLLGRGGFAEVWRAERLSDGHPVALKLLSAARTADDKAFMRFEREGRLASRLNHPRAVYVLAAERIDGYPVIVMDVAEGGSLQQLVEAEGSLPVARAVDLTLDLLDGLEAAHALQIVHRDVKPSNGFLDLNGRAKIGDFGISQSLDLDAALMERGRFAGTLQYAAPEQILGKQVDFRSDLYSLGATLYYLLTGRPPFQGTSIADFHRRVVEDPPAAPSSIRRCIPKRLDLAVLALLEKDPARRPAAHSDVRAMLARDSTREWRPALRRVRVVAGILDYLIVQVLAFPIFIFFHPTLARGVSPALGDFSIAEDLSGFALMVLYYAGFESAWAKTPGKALLRLRVATSTGRSPRTVNVLARGVLFVLPFSLADVFLFAGELNRYEISVLNALLFAGLFATQTSKNGRAAVHDLLTGTRIFALPHRNRSPQAGVQAIESVMPSVPEAPQGTVGPYDVLETKWRIKDRSLRIAFDAALGRRVWIHERSGEDGRRGPIADEPERSLRLRWVRGATEPGLRWDAFECPDGQPLREWVSAQGARPWEQAYGLINVLLREFVAGTRNRDLPVTLDVDHALVSPDGSLKLAEFPLTMPTETSQDPVNPSRLAWEVAILLLEGRERSAADELDASPRTRLPERAWTFVKRLHGSPGDPETLQRLRIELDEISVLLPPLNRMNRVGQFALLGGLPVVFGLMTSVVAFGPLGRDWLGASVAATWVFLVSFSPFAALAVLAAVLMKRGVLFGRTFQVSAVTAGGAPASRIRCAVRALAAWSLPLMLGVLTLALEVGSFRAGANTHVALTPPGREYGYQLGRFLGDVSNPIHHLGRSQFLLTGVLILCALLLWLCGVVASVVTPNRGWQDRIAGTWLVRR